MLASRRGGWIRILRLALLNIQQVIHSHHALSADGNVRTARSPPGRVVICGRHAQRVAIATDHPRALCEEAVHSSVGRLFVRLPKFLTKFATSHTRKLLDGAWLAPFIFKPVGLFYI